MTAQPPEDAETWEGYRLARDLRNEAVCNALGLDVTEVTGIKVEVTPGERPTVTWEGKRHLTADEVARLIEVFALSDDPGPPFT